MIIGQKCIQMILQCYIGEVDVNGQKNGVVFNWVYLLDVLFFLKVLFLGLKNYGLNYW